MTKEIKISYENRIGKYQDLSTVPKLVLANHFLEKVSGFSIGDKVTVQYLEDSIVIRKLNSII